LVRVPPEVRRKLALEAPTIVIPAVEPVFPLDLLDGTGYSRRCQLERIVRQRVQEMNGTRI